MVGNATATDDDYNNVVELPVSQVAIEDVLESNELGAVKSAHLPVSNIDQHRDDDDVVRRLCGTSRCEAGRGRCERVTDGPLCVCVDGYYGPDCQQRTPFTAQLLKPGFHSNAIACVAFEWKPGFIHLDT